MGYSNDSLGATPSIRTFAQIFATKTPTAPTPVKVQIAPAPVPNPLTALTSFIQKRSPVAPTPTPVQAPIMVRPETPAQAAAPLVAAAAAPAVGPIAAVIPPIVDAAERPSPTRIRIAPAPESTDLTPVTSGGGPELYAKDGTPLNEAAVSAATPNLLEQIQKLPPLALAGIAVGALFLLRKR